MKIFYTTLLLALLAACNSGNNANGNNTNNTGGDSVKFTTESISAERTHVNPNPVKTYAETIKTFETTDEFKVAVIETSKTFYYLIKINYKGLKVEDTLKVPNFGIEPAVEIVKGDSIRPSCVIGFFDKEKKFRESKLVAFDNNRLKVKVLKHYTIYQSDGE